MTRKECEFCGARMAFRLMVLGFYKQDNGLYKVYCTNNCEESYSYKGFPYYIPVNQRQRYVDCMEERSLKERKIYLTQQPL